MLLLHARTLRAKNKPAMADDITTHPMLEELLEGQRQLAALMADLGAAFAAMSQKQVDLATKVGDLTATPMRPASTRGCDLWIIGGEQKGSQYWQVLCRRKVRCVRTRIVDERRDDNAADA